MALHKTINSIVRASNVLRCLADGVGRVSEISHYMGLPKGTTHRLLKTLESTGFVVQDPVSRLYSLGNLITELASNPLITHQNLIVCSYEEMEKLRDSTSETVLLHVRVGLERVILEEVQSPHNLRYSSGKGDSSPIYTGAAGKVLLSELEQGDLEILLKNTRLLPITKNTITDQRVLFKEVEEARKHGYAESCGEAQEGSAAVAVPIRNYACPLALSIVGPESRFLLKRMSCLDELKRSADKISRKLTEIAPLQRRPRGRPGAG